MSHNCYSFNDVVSFKASLNVRDLGDEINYSSLKLSSFTRRYFDILKDVVTFHITGEMDFQNFSPSLNVSTENIRDANIAKEIIQVGFELFPDFVSEMEKGNYNSIYDTVEKAINYKRLNESLSEHNLVPKNPPKKLKL